MDADEYNGFWQKITESGGTNDHGNPFWMEVQEILNKDLADLFLKCGISHPIIPLDDDKMHYNLSFETNTVGLKQQRHVKTNRIGFTTHTSTLAAMDVPLRVDMERINDTPHSCYDEWQMREMFG
jgi:hypothetical protein